ncbi:hypothetical protein WDZ92_46980, partial [Nostoc sp. NIES-2111]
MSSTSDGGSGDDFGSGHSAEYGDAEDDGGNSSTVDGKGDHSATSAGHDGGRGHDNANTSPPGESKEIGPADGPSLFDMNSKAIDNWASDNSNAESGLDGQLDPQIDDTAAP